MPYLNHGAIQIREEDLSVSCLGQLSAVFSNGRVP